MEPTPVNVTVPAYAGPGHLPPWLILSVRVPSPNRAMGRILLFLTFCAVLTLDASSPPLRTPPAPLFPAAEAARLADDYVAKKFPQFPALYCSEISYDSDGGMKPDPTVIWRLRYLIPNNPRKDIEGSPYADWGVCLIFVHKNRSVSHSTEPKQH